MAARHRTAWCALAGVLVGCASPTIESGSAPRSTLPPATTIDAGEDDAVPASTTAETPPPIESTTTTTGPTTPAAPVELVTALTGWEAVDQYLDITLVRGGSDAASIAVLQDGELQHAGAYGERVPGDLAEPGDRFRVASISKTIAAITALRLSDAGTIDLDTPVGPFLATDLGVSSPTSGIAQLTVRHLLTHRSGFAQYEDLFFRNQVASCREAAVVGLTRSLQGTPGGRFQYSNLNFCLLGIAIEVLTGERFEAVVRREVLEPLGIDEMRMADTFDVGVGDVEHRSDEGRNYMEVLGAAGAWIASPEDLVTILDAIDPATPGTKLLDAETLDAMREITIDPPAPVEPDDAADPTAPATSTTLPPAPTRGYGMGLMIFDADASGPLSYGHTGTLESTHAMFVRRPDGITWAVTVSGDYPASTRDLAKIVDNALLLGGFTDGSYVVIPEPL